MKSNRLNFSFRRLLTAGAVSATLTLTGGPVSAVPLIWDNSDNDQVWLNANNWDGSIIPLATSDVELPKPIPGVSGILTLGGGSVANSLSFFAPYTLTGGDLALTSGGVRVTIGNTSTIASQLTGAGGLLKTGDGALILSNALNDYTGTTEIDAGSIIVTNQAALGGDASAVVVTGNATRGSGGGNLTINGGISGLTWTRALDLTGGGPTGDGTALNTVGNNVFTGAITTGGNAAGMNPVSGTPYTTSVTRLASTYGTSTISGPMALGGGTTAGVLTQFSGNGNWILSGAISGDGGLEKSGNGLLILSGTNNSYQGVTQVSAGFLRLASAANLGSNTSNAGITINGGKLEIRSDAPDFTAINNKITQGTSGTTGAIYLDRSVGGAITSLNKTVATGLFTLTASTTARTLTINSRNGYGMTMTGSMAAGGQGAYTLTNNGNGLFTYSGNFYNTNNTTARALTINGNGDSLITGNILATGADHTLTKAGTGTLTINGTGSNYLGVTNINAGTLAVRDFRALNNGSAAAINIGTGTTAGILTIGSDQAATAAGLTTNKVINLAGTTAAATINASQSIASPVILNANFTATGGSATQGKTLTFGGTNTSNNIVNGIIPNNSAGGLVSLVKSGTGTWVLAGANTFTGATQINGGVLKIQDTFSGTSRNVMSDSSALGFVAGAAAVGTAGGTFQYLGAAGVASAELLGPLMPAAGAGTVLVTAGSGGTSALTFASIGTAQTTTAASAASTTVTVASTVGLVPGMRVNGGSAAATISSITNDTTFVVSAAQTLASGAALTFDRPNGGATVNFAPDGNSSVIIGAVPSTGLLNSYSYFGGSSFAYAPTTTNATLRAPIYDTDAGFVTAGAALTASSHNLVTGNTSTGALAISSLKIDGTTAPVVTQTGLLTVREGAAGTSGGILVTGGSATLAGSGGVTTGGAADLIIRVDGVNDVLNLNTPVTAATTGGLTKTGAGTLVIGAVNAQTTGGSTNLLEGTIKLSTGGRLSANSVNLNMRQGTVLDLNGITTATSATASSIGAFNGDGMVTNTSATPVVFAVGGGTTGGSGTFNGTINETSGQISVVKMGTTNSQTWNGISNYTGSTTIGVPGTATTGSVTVMSLANIGQDSGIGRGDGTSTATNQASLIFGGTTGGLTYAGADSVGTDRLFTLAGTAAGAGATITANGLNLATLQFTNSNPIAFSGSAAQLLNLGGTSTGDNLFRPRLTDNGANPLSLKKIAAGLWILDNNGNSYTGTTQIDAGQLQIEGTSLPTASTVVINGGVLQSTGSITRNLTAVPAAGAGGINWSGNGGFAASTDKLTVNIGGNVTPDTLTWATGGFVSGNLILSSATAMAEVDVLNNMDLNGAVRTIQVDTNATTNSDFATLSGVISGGAGSGLTKTGSGILRLLSANTYEGNTTLTAGTVRAVSIGNSLSAASNFGKGTGAIVLNAGTLAYVGEGEISNRLIQTSASSTIESSGSGALVLTNVLNNSTTTAKTLTLTGDLNAANEITSVLSDNTGILTVTKSDNGTWILSGDNTYTGTTTVNGGALGIRGNSVGAVGAVTSSPVGVTRLTISNGSVFGLDGDINLNTLVRFNGNANSTFIGINNITLNSVETTTGGNTTVTNSLPEGKFLTINSPVYTGTETATARTLVFNGSGDTILNSSVTNSAGGAVINLTYQGYGSLTLGGSSGASTYTGVTTLTSGTLKVGSLNAIPFGVGAGNLLINPGTGLVATLDVNGFNQTVNGITAITTGVSTLDNSSTTAATLSFGAADQDVTFIGGTANSGAGALSITKVGTGTAILSQGPFEHKGATTVTGGLMTLAADVNGTSALNVSGVGSTLRLTGAFTGDSLVESISVGNGSTLSLLNGTGDKLDMLTSLTLGSASGTNTNLKLNVGGNAGDGFSGTDTWTLLTGGALNLFAGNKITFDLTDTNLEANTTYTLFNIVPGGLTSGPLTAGDFVLGATPGGFTSASLLVDNNLVQFTTGSLVTGDLFWNAAAALDNWNDLGNWSTTLDGLTPSTSLPGQGTNVVFKADNIAGNGAVATTLEQNFKVNRLNFIPATNPANTPTSVSIDPGADSLARLEIAPQNNTDGINIAAGGPANVSISTLLKLGADQTWTVADSGSTLTVSGALQGEAALIKAGSGRVVISSAAAASFNPGGMGTVAVNGGSFEITNVGALGTATIGNAAGVQINSGGLFYYNNATSGTVTNPITINGGSLAVAGNNQTYSGTVTITGSGSTILGTDALVPATARNVTLTGPLSGSGPLTVLGSATSVSGGAVLKADSSATFSGNILHNGGSIWVDNEGALGTGSYTASNTSANTGSRLLIRPANGQTFDITNILNVTGGSISEMQVDNISSTASIDAIGNVVNRLNLGNGSGSTAILRLFLADAFSVMNLGGGILLGDNASLSVGGGTGVLVGNTITVGGISETGGSRSLSINDLLGNTGAWTGNKTPTLAITAASSYTGGTTLSGGTVRLDVKDALGSGTINVGASSTLQAGSDLSGANAVMNAVTLNSTLIVSGGNNLTLGGVTTQSLGNRTLTNNLAAGTLRVNNLVMSDGAAARTLTVNGTGPTVIGTINNNGFTNILTNSVTGGGSLVIDTNIFLSEASGTGRTLTINGAGDTTVTGVIANFNGGAGTAGALTKSGASTLTLSNVNTYTGTTTINNGTLRYTVDNAIATGTVVVNGTATNAVALLDLDGRSDTIGALTFGGTSGVATSQNRVTTGAGTLTLGGTLTVTATGNWTTAATFVGNLGLGSATRTFSVADSTGTDVDLDLTQAIISNGGATARGITKTGVGTMLMGTANTYSGINTINAGIVRISTISNGGQASASLGTSSSAAANLVLGGGTLQYTGGTASTDRNYTLTAATTSFLDVSLPGTKLTMTGGSAATVASLTKTGAGTLELTGQNQHLGLTTVSQGTLLVNNTSGTGLAGNVTVDAGALLAGSGTLGGMLTVNGTVSPGNSVDMLTVGDFVLGVGGNAFFELSGATTNDIAGVNAYLANPGTFDVPLAWTNYQDGVTLHDHIRITGNEPTFDITGTITLAELGYTPVYGDVFQIFDWTNLGLSVAAVTPTFILPTGVTWNTDLFSSYGVAFVVPEPGRAMLLVFGLLGLVMRRRRR